MKDLVTMVRHDSVCDFCGASSPAWRYPCKSFNMAEIAPWGSEGDFAACEACSSLS